MDERTDSELLAAYRSSRDERVFHAIVERHGAMVYRACLRMTGNAHDAEDAAQAAFLMFAQRPQAVVQSLSGWLHGSAVRTSLNLVRSRSRRVKREQEAGKRMEASIEHAAELQRHQEGLTRELDRALALLPTKFREAVVLCHIEGHSQEAAAELINCPVGTLGWRVMEGVNRLRGILMRRGVVLSTGALTVFLAQEAAMSVPQASLAAMAATAAGAGTTSAKAAVLAKTAHQTLLWAKVKAAVTVAAVAAAVVTVPLVAQTFSAPPPKPVAPPAPAVTVAPAPASPVARAVAAPVDPLQRYKSIKLVQTLSDFPGGAHCIVFSPDGARYAVGTGRGIIRIYDAKANTLSYELAGHDDAVFAVGFARGGTTLASSSNDDTARIWDLKTRAEIHTMELAHDEHSHGVPGLSVSPDGARFATASWNGIAQIWDAASGREVVPITWKTNGSAEVQYSPDGKWLLVASNEGYVEVLDAKTGAEITRVIHSTSSACGFALSCDGTVLATADSKGKIRLWSVTNWRPQAETQLAAGPVSHICFSPDGLVVFACADHRIHVLDAKTLAPISRLDGHSADIPALAFGPGGRTLLSGSYDGSLKIWSLSEPENAGSPAPELAAREGVAATQSGR